MGSGLSLSTNSEGLAELSASDDEKKNKYEETGLFVVTSSNNTLIFSIAGDNFNLTLLWILVRLIYIPVYILGLKYFRTFIWMISFLILILMGIKFI